MDSQSAADRFSLFREYYDELLRFLTVRLRSHDQAMDLTQEAFLRVLRQRPSGPIQQPRAFLYKTALNLTADLFRNRQRQAEHSLESKGVQQALMTPPLQYRELELKERTRLLHEAVRELPPRCREVFLLHLFKQRNHDEIAAHFGISRSMVEKHILKATTYCRERLKARACL
ncbi:MAG: sigma-70 family RNA polymerase sigma factor [Nitrospira sp.]